LDKVSRRDFLQTMAAAAVGASTVGLQTAGADESSLALVSVLEHDGLAGAHDIEVRDGLAYVAGKTGRFAILDVSEAARPSLLSAIGKEDESALGNAETVLLVDDTCLLGTDALLAVDISHPAAPKITHVVDDERIDRLNGMVCWGERAIAVSKSGYLDLFDISNPRAPSLLGVADTRKKGTLRAPHDVARFGDRYLVVPSAGKEMPAYFGIYDVSRGGGEVLPADEWRCLGTVSDSSLAGANRIVADDRYAYVCCHYSHRLGVIDLADPHEPRLVTTVRTTGYEPDGLAKEGDLLFVGAGRTVEVFDIALPDTPRSIAVYSGDPLFDESDGPGRGNAHDLVVRDGFVYVTAQRDDRVGILTFRRHPQN